MSVNWHHSSLTGFIPASYHLRSAWLAVRLTHLMSIACSIHFIVFISWLICHRLLGLRLGFRGVLFPVHLRQLAVFTPSMDSDFVYFAAYHPLFSTYLSPFFIYIVDIQLQYESSYRCPPELDKLRVFIVFLSTSLITKEVKTCLVCVNSTRALSHHYPRSWVLRKRRVTKV